MKALSEFLRPEFLSRVDEVIVFRQLTLEDFEKIAALMLDEYVGSLKERHIHFVYDTRPPTGWRNMPSAGKAARATCAT